MSYEAGVSLRLREPTLWGMTGEDLHRLAATLGLCDQFVIPGHDADRAGT